MNVGLLFMIFLAVVVVTLAIVMSTEKGRNWILGGH